MIKMNINGKYHHNSKIILHSGDTMRLLSQMPSNSIKLIITSPPYNIGKEYEKKVAIEKYLQQQKEIISELVRVLHPEGSICWQVGNYVHKGEIYPLDVFYYQIFKELNLKLRNRIIWHFGFGLHAQKRFSGRYETLLWFTKNDEYTFNLDPVRIPSKYPGKRHYKGNKIGQPSGNPLGKNPSDFWKKIQTDWEEQVWDIPNVKANHPERTNHPCQFPVELVERCILALTDEGDRVFDPFAGTGTTLIASMKHNRKSIGSEKEAKYVDLIRNRLELFASGKLKTRSLIKPVHKPTGKVSKVPVEWK